MRNKLATRRHKLFCAIMMIAHYSLYCACAALGQIAMNTAESKFQNYPPVIEDSMQSRQATIAAWKKLIAEFRLPETSLKLEPALNTARSLPQEISGRIRLKAQTGKFGELEAKEALLRFIERASGIIFPNQMNGSAQSSVSLKDLSLISFENSLNAVYHAVYR